MLHRGQLEVTYRWHCAAHGHGVRTDELGEVLSRPCKIDLITIVQAVTRLRRPEGASRRFARLGRPWSRVHRCHVNRPSSLYIIELEWRQL